MWFERHLVLKMKSRLVVGTRGSLLARTQTGLVISALKRNFPSIAFDEKIIVTEGDKNQSVALASSNQTGLFTKHLEQELQNCQIDIAVHSCKDLPTRLPEGLHIVAIPPRDPSEDIIVFASDKISNISELPKGSRIGTGSVRRQVLLKKFHPELNAVPIRGNIDTRLRKLDEGFYDACILAKASLHRLSLLNKPHQEFSSETWFYAPGQGALAIETRVNDQFANEIVSSINDVQSHNCVDGERSILESLGSGCSLPLGVRSTLENSTLILQAILSNRDGTYWIEDSYEGDPANSKLLGTNLASKLFEKGASKLLGTN